MNKKFKIIALYLPQFHTIPENDEWWGKGFTEWTNVKKAKPLFEGHQQPKIPLNNNYYCLLDDDVKLWQENLAKEYGIYGFCYYHYWYNGKLLLEKPLEQKLLNQKLDLPFCMYWCNQPWTKSWVGNDNKVLISQTYGNKNEWIAHYNYLKKFFIDNRYIKINNKPLFGIYRPEIVGCIKDMLDCWSELAKRDGFDGIMTMCCVKDKYNMHKNFDYFDYNMDSLAIMSMNEYRVNSIKAVNPLLVKLRKIRQNFFELLERKIGHSFYKYSLFKFIRTMFIKYRNKPLMMNYEKIWQYALSLEPTKEKVIPCAFNDWDNTSRYGVRGSVFVGATPKKFKYYFTEFLIKCKKVYKSEYIMFQAWNEWAESSVLEPDEINKYGYLENIRDAINEVTLDE